MARLADDHRRAASLAERLCALGFDAVQRTNMVFVPDTDAPMVNHLAAADIIVSGPRWVLHLDVDDDATDRVADAAASWQKSHSRH